MYELFLGTISQSRPKTVDQFQKLEKIQIAKKSSNQKTDLSQLKN